MGSGRNSETKNWGDKGLAFEEEIARGRSVKIWVFALSICGIIDIFHVFLRNTK